MIVDGDPAEGSHPSQSVQMLNHQRAGTGSGGTNSSCGTSRASTHHDGVVTAQHRQRPGGTADGTFRGFPSQARENVADLRLNRGLPAVSGNHKILCSCQGSRHRDSGNLLPDVLPPLQTVQRPKQLCSGFARHFGTAAENVEMIHILRRDCRERDVLSPRPCTLIGATRTHRIRRNLKQLFRIGRLTKLVALIAGDLIRTHKGSPGAILHRDLHFVFINRIRH